MKVVTPNVVVLGASPACHLLFPGDPVHLSCWAVKGGVGTTVVTAALGLTLHHAGHDVLLVDLAGDLPTALGLPEPDGPGLTDWLAAGDDVPADGLGRIELAALPGLAVLPRGSGRLGPLLADARRHGSILYRQRTRWGEPRRYACAGTSLRVS